MHYKVERNLLRPNRKMLGVLQAAQDIACTIYEDPTCRTVGLCMGNYSGYGRYAVRFIKQARLIEVPLNPTFDLVRVGSGRTLDVVDPEAFRGALLHEYAHNSQYYHPKKPWLSLDIKAGKTCHSNTSWCWLCAKGWDHFNPNLQGALTAELLAWAVRRKLPTVMAALVAFDPQNDIEWLFDYICMERKRRTQTCEYCGTDFQPKRSDARFCSDRCRVYKSRSKHSRA